ncbi:MAG: MATE family efflux transporter, partial [Lachnospiraceae bacterium]|nr:MATE family efflux transporter [Lachnospiraceae bacterium]
QNLGAKEFDRAKKGAKFGIITSVLLAELVGITIFIFAPFLIALFNDEPAVVATGVTQARTISLFYCLLAFSHCIAGIMRGAGKATVPMFTMLATWCVIRISYITIVTRIIPEIDVIFWAYPLTWTLSSIIFFIYYKKADWLHNFA